MQYQIQGQPYPVVVLTVEPEETVLCQKGAMAWMTPNMEMQTKGGGLGKMFSRAFTGESMFQNHYTAKGGQGMIAFASSLDTAGLMAHTAEDIAWVLGDMVSYEPWDSTSENMPAEDFTRDLTKGVKGLKIGVPRAWFADKLDAECSKAIEAVIDIALRCHLSPRRGSLESQA